MSDQSDRGPSPALFFETVNAYQRTAVLKGAVDLDLFTAIEEGNATTDQIARRCNAAPRGVRILCDFLVVYGFLTKTGERYGLTKDSAAFLDRRSPAYLGGAIEFLLSDPILTAYRDVAALARKGGTTLPQEGTTSTENPIWVKFARGMAPLMAPAAQWLAELLDPTPKSPLRVLDVAAGHGLYGLAFARRNSAARVTALDWPGVLAVAKENAQRLGVVDRFATIPGSAFDVDWGRGYDLVLLPNFLHHFDIPTCEKLLAKAHTALAPRGRVAVLEFVPNDDRVWPPGAATFAMQMLATTPAGDAYTFRELQGMLRNGGFTDARAHSSPDGFETAVVAPK